ncbi:zinc finger protein 660-like [Neocloeon triangulifer]|uniref:zinc finger protein 660-like n=1 Tax=Neocloeon triangulifer TaxID=2078957 RepID=UPI00286F5DC4|nr:zinc finger protein 660-like [Neocloeon triangulifer]XP_059480745.1 zinc finger protein 660-like [Neocloeon triangulifer]
MRRKQQSESRAGPSGAKSFLDIQGLEAFESCRLCSHEGSNGATEIFSEKGIKKNLPALIKNYLKIVVSESDLLSKSICKKCCDHLVKFHLFAQNVKTVQDKLEEQKFCMENLTEPKIEAHYQDEHASPLDNYLEANHSSSVEKHIPDDIVSSLGLLSDLPIDLSSDDFDEPDGLIKIKEEAKDSEPEEDLEQDDQVSTTSEEEEEDSDVTDSPSTRIRSDIKEQEKELSEFYKLTCSECEYKCTTFASLSSHCKKTHDCRPTIFCHCGKSFNRRSHLIRHRNQHLGVHRYKCETCERGFHFKFMLRSHMYTHGPESDKPFKCDECQRSYITKSGLTNHKTMKHLPPRARVSCDICNNTFSHPNCLYTHKKTVHGDQRHFVCHICGKTMSTVGNLKGHLETHKESCNVQCEVCGKRFKTRMRLVRHMEYHKAVVHECQVCGKQYQTRGSLRSHLLVHSDDRPHKCNLCQKTFKRSKQLKLHLYQHTGERPYKCPFCPKTFTNAGNRATHKRRIHSKVISQSVIEDNSASTSLFCVNEEISGNLNGQQRMSSTEANNLETQNLQSMAAVLNQPAMMMGGMMLPLQTPNLQPVMHAQHLLTQGLPSHSTGAW